MSDLYDPFEDDSLISEKNDDDVEVELDDEEEEEEEEHEEEEEVEESSNSLPPQKEQEVRELLQYTEELEEALEELKDQHLDLQERHEEAIQNLNESGIALVLADRVSNMTESKKAELKQELLPKSEFDTPSEFKEHLDRVIEKLEGDDQESLNESKNRQDPLGEGGKKVKMFHNKIT